MGLDAQKFQSSPGPKAQCNNRSPLIASPLKRSNPHQALRPSATSQLLSPELAILGFQSSPGPKAQCNGTAPTTDNHFNVPILTRP